MDDMDDRARMGEETIQSYPKQFLRVIFTLYCKFYLNCGPDEGGLKNISTAYDNAGFLRYAGCLDCMKLAWKNCPLSEKGQYHNGS